MPRQQHGVVAGRCPVRSGYRARPTVALAPGDPALLLAAPHGRKHPVGGEARGDESLVPPAAISLPRRNATRFAGHMVTRWGAVLRCCDCRPWRRAPLARRSGPPNWPVEVARQTPPPNWAANRGGEPRPRKRTRTSLRTGTRLIGNKLAFRCLLGARALSGSNPPPSRLAARPLPVPHLAQGRCR